MDRSCRGKSRLVSGTNNVCQGDPEGALQISPRHPVCRSHTDQRRRRVRSLVFPYTQLGGHFVPMIPVTLFGRSTSFKTAAYVDSGAFCSIFHSEILAALQLPKGQGRVTNARRPPTENSFARTLFFFRANRRYKNSRAGCFFGRTHCRFQLAGRQAIFSSFDEVAFRERDKQVIFRARA